MRGVMRGTLLVCVVIVGTWGVNAAPAFADGPVTVPTITAPTDSSTVAGDVALTATSTAGLVQFYVDAAPLGAPVAVSAGTASTTWSTWGLTNGGPFTLTAADCDISACNVTQSTAVGVTLSNTVPVITAPVDSSNTSETPTFTATAPGGGVQFAVDGTVVGFDGTSPYSFTVTNALTEGAHTLGIEECDVANTQCNGPVASDNFTVVMLHPTITSVAPNPFSPHPDGRDDVAAFKVHLPDTENVTFRVKNGGGQTVSGPHNVGSFAAGDHTFHWDGKGQVGQIAADGVYTIQVDTTAVVGGVAEDGTVTRTVTVDDTGSTVKGAGGNGATFYPVVDGYQDTFGPMVTVNEPGTLWLQIYTSTGTFVNQVELLHSGTGTFQINWNGRNKHNALAAEGTFQYHFLAQDLAGNRSHTGNGLVHLSHKRLVTKSATITRTGISGGLSTTDQNCTGFSTTLTKFVNGVFLDNFCHPSTDGLQWIFAEYSFAVPAAIQYNTIVVQSFGRTNTGPETLAAVIYNARLAKFASVGATTLAQNNVNLTNTYGKVPAASCVNSSRHVTVDLGIPDKASNEEIYDIGTVSIVLSYSVLG